MKLLGPLTDLVAKAGLAILAVDRAAMDVSGKPDGSPVTAADLAADGVIAEGLARLAASVFTLSEETCARGLPGGQRSYFLIDPLDGTKEFIAGRDEFTVNIALLTDGVPLLGVVGAPALGQIWRGVVGAGAERLTLDHSGAIVGAATAIHSRRMPEHAPCVVAVSRSHGDPATAAFIDRRPGAVRQAIGSALKFCRVAEGSADIYPRLAPTHAWDVAAGHAVVVAAGGCVTDSRGQPLSFGETRGDFIIPEFIAWGDPAAAPRSARA
ncbi:MAG: 3'(2'),5'-bisphosphate nucleotidase CysQ [Xanthobacteraceae bacterium]|nr:3'(2'),5'-bisphosphate nucleotidase CysQ [Xanthobacteraceae bacterium]